MQFMKFITAGDTGVGKTSFLCTWTCGNFPIDYIPTVFDSYCANIKRGSITINVQPWDSAGADDYERLRPLSYPGTDVFVLCYDLNCEVSLEHCRTKWYSELKSHCPLVPVVLVGMKSDLRQAMGDDEIDSVASTIGAFRSMKCSSKEQTGLTEVIDAVCDAWELAKSEFSIDMNDNFTTNSRPSCIVQ